MKIVLIGFMGSGKSTVSKKLAHELDLEMVEMDDLVLKKSGEKSIKEIFANKGEVHFRELEIEVAKGLIHRDNLVISTGGGVVMNKIIIDYLKEKGKIIYLKTSFETIVKRLAGNDDRPLFNDKEKAKNLYNFRQSLYENYADKVIDTDKRNVDQIVNKLIKIT